ncbi:hypothetical protein BSKO_08547 [Bryopsis sp. KO-2023]|nr:hypothetical protein BSKO_08547 [Bryopsis sp. KO-2023]
MLMFSNGTALVVLRGFKSNNPRTWAIPGGNIDTDDVDLFETAEREVKEELGRLPVNLTMVDEIVTERGSDDKKYTVFLVEVPVEAKAIYYPILNKEHTDFKWFPYAELFRIFNLHPVLKELLKNHRTDVERAFGLQPSPEKKLSKSQG